MSEVLELTASQIEALYEARQRALAEQRAAFIDDLVTGIGALTEAGARQAEEIVAALRARADGETASAGYTEDTVEYL